MLYAGSEVGIFASFDDGDDWQPLQLNLPVTSVRDLVIHRDDLVIGTHGRSFWILDDVTPLRQMSDEVTNADVFLFAPQTAVRWRWNRNTDTPLPPEEPVGQNPPDGAIIDYTLKASSGPVALEIYDFQNRLVRRYSSEDKPDLTETELEKEINVPTYWVRQPHILSAAPGMHRFVWDLRYAPPKALEHDYPISAIVHNTPRVPRGALVLPGDYTVKLSAAGKTYSQKLTVIMDPRVTTPRAGLEEELSATLRLQELMSEDYEAVMGLRNIQQQLLEAEQKTPQALMHDLHEFGQKLAALDGEPRRRSRGTASVSLSALNGQLAEVLEVIQGSDNAPTQTALRAVKWLDKAVSDQLSAFQRMKDTDLVNLNEKMRAQGLAPLELKK